MRNLIDALVTYTVHQKDLRRGCALTDHTGDDWAEIERWARPQGLTANQALDAYRLH